MKKESEPELNPDPEPESLVRGTDPGIRIRTKMLRIPTLLEIIDVICKTLNKNVPAVAKKVVVACFRFVSGKPLIDANTVPRFEFRFDAFRGRSFAEQLRAKIPMFPSLLLAHSRQVKSPFSLLCRKRTVMPLQ
jgi:hypothetical protein